MILQHLHAVLIELCPLFTVRGLHVLCVLLVILAGVFAAAFVGGYSLGKDKGKTESKESQSYQHRGVALFRSQPLPLLLTSGGRGSDGVVCRIPVNGKAIKLG